MNEIPNPNGENPGKVVDAEKLISYPPVSKIVKVSEVSLKVMLFNSKTGLNWMFVPGDIVCGLEFPIAAIVTGIGVPAAPVTPAGP